MFGALLAADFHVYLNLLGETVTHTLIKDPVIISIYHEILQNEIAIMRGNYPLLLGVRSRNAIYYVTSFPQFTSTSNPRRALDFATLSYAVVNGLRRYVCGYDADKPHAWDRKHACTCIEKIIKEAERIVQESEEKRKYEAAQREHARRRAEEAKFRESICQELSGLYLKCPVCSDKGLLKKAEFIPVENDWLTADSVHKLHAKCSCGKHIFSIMDCSRANTFVEKYAPRK